MKEKHFFSPIPLLSFAIETCSSYDVLQWIQPKHYLINSLPIPFFPFSIKIYKQSDYEGDSSEDIHHLLQI